MNAKKPLIEVFSKSFAEIGKLAQSAKTPSRIRRTKKESTEES